MFSTDIQLRIELRVVFPVYAWVPVHVSVIVCVQVINVDDDGNELGSGVMELTDAELVLHTHRRDDVRWPYLCLRRYGYDSNLFSFESGRRCQTGQGTCQISFTFFCVLQNFLPCREAEQKGTNKKIKA